MLDNISGTSVFQISVDGRNIQAKKGQTVAFAMIESGIKIFRHTEKNEPRGVFCGQGICFDCLVTIDGIPEQRACVTPVQEGMIIETGINSSAESRND